MNTQAEMSQRELNAELATLRNKLSELWKQIRSDCVVVPLCGEPYKIREKLEDLLIDLAAELDNQASPKVGDVVPLCVGVRVHATVTKVFDDGTILVVPINPIHAEYDGNWDGWEKVDE